MFKLLRKYNKYLVVIGGAFLMVAFLLPQAISQFGQSGAGSTYSTMEIDGRTVKVTLGEVQREYRQELQVLQEIRFAGLEYAYIPRIVQFGQVFPEMVQLLNSLEFVPEQTQGQLVPLSELLGIRNLDHWIMLSEQANAARLVGGAGDGQNLLDRLSGKASQDLVLIGMMLGQPVDANDAQLRIREELINEISSIQGRYPQSTIDSALAKAHGVLRLRESLYTPLSISGPEIQFLLREQSDRATVKAAYIRATSRMNAMPEPTDGQLRAHFDEFAAVDPSEQALGLGYREEDAVKVSALHVDVDAIRSAVTLNDIDVNARYQANRNRFPGDFVRSKPAVEEEMRSERAEEIMDGVRSLVERAIQQVRGIAGDRDEDGFYTLPEDWAEQKLNLEELTNDVNTFVSAELELIEAIQPARVVERTGDWLAESDLRAIPGLGFSLFNPGSPNQRAFPDYALRVQELQGDLATRQVGLLNPRPLLETSGDRWWVRIEAARPSGPPESLDEVRDQVANGVRLLESYRRLEEDAPTMLESIITSAGFGGISDDGGVEIRSQIQVQTINMRQLGQAIGDLPFDAPELRDQVIALARDLGTQEGGVQAAPIDARLVWYASQDIGGVVFLEIEAYRPLVEEEYQARVASSEFTPSGLVTFVDQISSQAKLSALPARSALSFDAMAERLNYQAAGGDAEEELLEEETTEEVDAS
ncbi:MAG: hypothetical protein AAGB34_04395 [Planctomycetota bacterium]